jgi:hypothetical protein
MAILLTAFIAAIPAGCVRDRPGGSGADSAFASAPQFEFSEPLFTAAESKSGDSVQFAFAQLIRPLMVNESTVVVGSAGELIHLDTEGKAMRVAGRRGDGPGEFSSMQGLFHADTLTGILDRGGKVVLYTHSGDFVRDVPIPGGPLTGAAGWMAGYGPVVLRGLLGGPREYALHDAAGAAVRPLLQMPAIPSLRVAGASPSVECTPRYFETVVGATLYVVDQDSGTLQSVTADGASRTIYTSRLRRAITEKIIAFFIRPYEAAQISRDSMDLVLRRFGKPGDPLPYTWDAIVADPGGRIWLRLAECELDAIRGERAWEVIDTAGALVGVHRSRSNLRSILNDRALVVTYDSLDRVSVNVVRIIPVRR